MKDELGMGKFTEFSKILSRYSRDDNYEVYRDELFKLLNYEQLDGTMPFIKLKHRLQYETDLKEHSQWRQCT